MNGIDPDGHGAARQWLRNPSALITVDNWNQIIASVQQLLAEHDDRNLTPQVAKLPPEDRTRTWRDKYGYQWFPAPKDDYWWRESSSEEPYDYTWGEVISGVGPLTDAGPA